MQNRYRAFLLLVFITIFTHLMHHTIHSIVSPPLKIRPLPYSIFSRFIPQPVTEIRVGNVD